MLTDIFRNMCRRYGMQLAPRFDKLEEEFNELMEAWHSYRAAPDIEKNDALLDELADVNIIIFHIAGLLHMTHGDLVRMAHEKITQRDINPNYKRTHPHETRQHDNAPGHINK